MKDLKSGATLAGSSYEYDALGRITKATDTKINAYTTYAYDTQGQLLTAKVYNAGGALQKTYTYTYDTVGNLLTASDGSTAHTYAYGDEQWRDLLTAYDGHAIPTTRRATP